MVRQLGARAGCGLSSGSRPRRSRRSAQAIAEAGGNEVFLVGELDEDGRVASVTVGARGSDEAVPGAAPAPQGRRRGHPQPSLGRASRPSRARPRASPRGSATRASGSTSWTTTCDEVYVVAEPVQPHARSPRSTGRTSPRALAARGRAEQDLVPWFEERPEPGRHAPRRLRRLQRRRHPSPSRRAPGSASRIAYLLPAVAWAARNGERVVVSTNTINLQQQLVEKDIPLVKRVLGGRTTEGRPGEGTGQLPLPGTGSPRPLEETTLFEEPDAGAARHRGVGAHDGHGRPDRPLVLSLGRDLVEGLLRGRRVPRPALQAQRRAASC